MFTNMPIDYALCDNAGAVTWSVQQNHQPVHPRLLLQLRHSEGHVFDPLSSNSQRQRQEVRARSRL